MECPRCGRSAQEGVVYCGYCGWKIESEVTPAEKFSGKLSDLPDELMELVPLDTWKTTKTNTEETKPAVEDVKPLAVRGTQALVQATLPVPEPMQLAVPEERPLVRKPAGRRSPKPRRAPRKSTGKKSAPRTRRKSK